MAKTKGTLNIKDFQHRLCSFCFHRSINQSINQSVGSNQIKSINQSYQSNQSSNRSVNRSTIDRSIHQSNNQIIYILGFLSLIHIYSINIERERERGREKEKNSPNNSSAKYIVLSLRSMTRLSRFSWVLSPPQSHVS